MPARDAVDLQGSEVVALRGAKRLLDRQLVSWIFCEFDPFLLEKNGASASTLLDLLHVSGFSCVNARSKSWRPWNYYKVDNGSNIKHFWTNLLCGHRTVARWVGDRDWRRQILSEHHQLLTDREALPVARRPDRHVI